MNRILCEFPAATIYKQTLLIKREKREGLRWDSDGNEDEVRYIEYHPANDVIADQVSYLCRIPGTEKSYFGENFYFPLLERQTRLRVGNPLLQLVIDSKFPLVVIVLKTERNSFQGRFSHTPLISGIIHYIRQLNTIQYPEESDYLFWKKRLLIVAPHHIQRLEIRDQLRDKKYPWTQKWTPSDDQFIQTVERAQGQEVDTVVVDYGITEVSQIKKEISFIYSRNRLNVAITRAKKKCVVVLSDVLLKTVFGEVFGNMESEVGFDYMQTLVDFAKTKNSYTELGASAVKKFVQDLEEEQLFSINK